jgi:hypothetical protein
VSLLAVRPELLSADSGSATATRLVRSLVDVSTSARSQITGCGLLGTPAVCQEQAVAALDKSMQVANLADRRTRMQSLQEEHLRSIERAQSSQVSLVDQYFADRAGRLSCESPHSLLRVPVRSEQVGPEMPYDGVLGRCRNELDNGEPVSHCIMIIGPEYRSDFKGWSPIPAPPAGEDLPDAVHPEVSVQRELIAESE